MSEKIVVIISSSDSGKACTGAMYAVNTLKNDWMADVKLFIFGPAQELLLKDKDLQDLMTEYQSMEQTAIACKFIADRDKNSEQTSQLGVKVDYVGKKISDYIKEGYIPMVW